VGTAPTETHCVNNQDVRKPSVSVILELNIASYRLEAAKQALPPEAA